MHAFRYIGWADSPLTPKGEKEALEAGQILQKLGLNDRDLVYTSYLRRAIKTAWLALQQTNQEHLACEATYLLNERMYGLCGLNYEEAVAKHGKEQVDSWGKSIDDRAPPVPKGSELDPGIKARYKFLGDAVPQTESLRDAMKRADEFWDSTLEPALRAGKKVMVVSHANLMRCLMRRIDDIPDEKVWSFEVPRAIPVSYSFDQNLKPLRSARPGKGKE